MSSVTSGLERLLQSKLSLLKGARIAVLANQASVDSCYKHAVDLLHKELGSSLIRIFGPEHGFRGELQDMEGAEDSKDGLTGLPVRSLYGSTEETLRPKTEDLQDIDILIADLPDIGSRYYTYAQTLGYAMQTAKQAGTKVLVADRPNPIGGEQIEGGTLLGSCRSFCGYAPVPQRHGLTFGELAKLMNEGFGEGEEAIPAIECELEVIKCEGWRRTDYFDQTGLPWVYPSPNMPTLDTAIIYPGSCLFEGTELSEGRGTTKPLEIFGAPYINGSHWADAVHEQGVPLSGAVLRPLSFIPKFQKHSGEVCGGVQLHVTDRKQFQPFRWGLSLISAAKQLYPDEFSWRTHTYEFLSAVPAIDLLYGSSRFREAVDSGEPLDGLTSELLAFENSFAEKRESLLLY